MTSWELRVSIDISKPLCRGRIISLADEGNDWEEGMERNEKNNFRIFFHSLIWEF